jgi:hypothetical protein
LTCALSALSCSGKNEGSATCSNTPACGGNIVGTWKIVSTCVSSDESTQNNPSCPGETVKASGVTATGTATYGSDGTYSTNFTINGSAILTIPGSCLKSGNIMLTCDQLQQSLSGAATDSFSAVTCSASGDGCSCTLTLKPTPSMSNGTYTTTAAGVLTETTGSGSDQNDYCVKGSTLTISPHAGSTMSTSTGTITLQKQ